MPWTYGRESSERPQRLLRIWGISLMRKGSKRWDAPPGEEKAQGDFFYICKCLMGKIREDEARLFSILPSGRTRVNGHNTVETRLLLRRVDLLRV